MYWRRGIRRLWFIIAAIWCSLILFTLYSSARSDIVPLLGSWAKWVDFAEADGLARAGLIIGPPMALGVLAWSLTRILTTSLGLIWAVCTAAWAAFVAGLLTTNTGADIRERLGPGLNAGVDWAIAQLSAVGLIIVGAALLFALLWAGAGFRREPAEFDGSSRVNNSSDVVLGDLNFQYREALRAEEMPGDIHRRAAVAQRAPQNDIQEHGPELKN